MIVHTHLQPPKPGQCLSGLHKFKLTAAACQALRCPSPVWPGRPALLHFRGPLPSARAPLACESMGASQNPSTTANCVQAAGAHSGCPPAPRPPPPPRLPCTHVHAQPSTPRAWPPHWTLAQASVTVLHSSTSRKLGLLRSSRLGGPAGSSRLGGLGPGGDQLHSPRASPPRESC